MEVAEKIAGEIALSNQPGKTIKKWRSSFGLSQQELATKLKISPSVISDYETSRRKAPNVLTLRKLISAMLELAEARGSELLKGYNTVLSHDAILDIKEFSVAVPIQKFVRAIKGKIIASREHSRKELHGYTVIDSLKVITSFSPLDYLKLYGYSTERALIFTGVKYGRSPMVAVRAHPVKPAAVVYQKPGRVDALAIKLAELEKIPLIVTKVKIDKVIKSLRKLGE